jgi:hypothetical protein
MVRTTSRPVLTGKNRRPILARTIAAGLVASTALTSLPAIAADAPTGGMPGTRAFVLSTVYIATPHEAGVCSELTQGGPEIFLKSLPKHQQAQLSTPDKHDQLFGVMQAQLGFKWFAMVPRGTSANKDPNQPGWPTLEIDSDPASARIEDVRGLAGIPEGKGAIVFNHHIVAYDSCTNPDDFPMLNQGFHPYYGKLAYGIDLGAKNSASKFTSPAGDKKVDNQLWRVTGCMKHFREFGDPESANNTLFSAAAPTLIEVTGIDDERNDSDVSVAVYSSADVLQTDSRGKALAHASFSIDPRANLAAHTRGRISNGILMTDPVDIRLRYKEQIIDNIRELRGTRIRATFKPDGSIEGGFYGYYTLESYYDSIRQMSQLGANLSSLSCPTIHAAIQEYADGYPDPKTKRNTAISSALNFLGVSAFVIRPSDKSSVATN